MTTIDLDLAMPLLEQHTMERVAKHESRKRCLQSGPARPTAIDYGSSVCRVEDEPINVLVSVGRKRIG